MHPDATHQPMPSAHQRGPAPPRNADLAIVVDRLPDDAMVTPAEAGAFLGYHPVTLRKWVREQRGPTCRLLEKRPRYRMGDLRAWARGQ